MAKIRTLVQSTNLDALQYGDVPEWWLLLNGQDLLGIDSDGRNETISDLKKALDESRDERLKIYSALVDLQVG